MIGKTLWNLAWNFASSHISINISTNNNSVIYVCERDIKEKYDEKPAWERERKCIKWGWEKKITTFAFPPLSIFLASTLKAKSNASDKTSILSCENGWGEKENKSDDIGKLNEINQCKNAREKWK